METEHEARRAWRVSLKVLPLLSTALWLVSSALLWGQTLAQQPQEGARSAVKILTPKEGEELNTNIVHCKYELVQPATANEPPTFQLQLDDQDQVRTMMTDHTFTGLKEGRHEITMMVLDANDNPIPGTMAEVHFKVLPQQPPPKSSGAAPPQQRSAAAKMEAASSSMDTPAQNGQAQGQLPEGGSPLPLLSVICGGALAGGTISVLRTRGRRKRS